MEARIEKLEEFAVDAKKRLERLEEFATDTRERLVRIETRLDQMATKADLHELASTMVKWIVGSVSGMAVAAITVVTFVLNNAVPKAPAAPIIIYARPAPAIQQPAPATPAPAAKK
ncbi:hypothetical protein ACLB1G_26270 [Oxalobacteraceae bacterium A2-2]